jgi:lysophospholipase L1-like esterase
VAFCLLAGIPVIVALTPGQPVDAFGQRITVGARPPEPSLAGPARLVQVGNTSLDLDRLQVYGPLRPQLTMGPVQRNAESDAVFDPQQAPRVAAAAVGAVTGGFVTWFVLGGLGLLAFTLAASGMAAGLRTLLVLRRQSRSAAGPWENPADSLAAIWARCVRAAGGMTAVAVAVSVLAWAVSGVLAYSGAVRGLSGVTSLAQIVGAYHLAPAPVGPPLSGYGGAVIGDSRAARVGGPPVPTTGPDARPDDATCGRSSDSLASEIGHLLPARTLNLACPGATVNDGLRGSQDIAGNRVPAQVGVLEQVQGLRFVVVAIGPNDVGWTDFLRYCYGVPDCSDQLTQGEFDYRLAAFDRAYGDLLLDLSQLPGRPQVIVTTSYEPFLLDADCPDTRAAGFPGLDRGKIELLEARNDRLNAVLAAGAEKYGFSVARPELRPLCATGGGIQDRAAGGLGPDLQGLADPYPFHPTGVGSLRIASAVVRLVAPPPAR